MLPDRIDVAIVGAGFAGCATARALVDRGHRSILVIEREPELGRHASGRGAGLGRQLAEDDETTALTVRGAALLRARYPEAWSPTGGMLGFDDPAAATEYVARAARLGVACERLDGAAARARLAHDWPLLDRVDLASAIFVPSDGVIDVKRLLAALADGLPITTGVDVRAIRDGIVETSHGTVAARVVVDASGAWAGATTGDPALAVWKRHLFVLESVAPTATPFFWHLGARELYVRPGVDGIVASPCDREATPPRPQTPSSDADARLRDRLGHSAGAWNGAIARRWACQRAFAPDHRMRLGRDATRPWLVWAAALGGHGATAAVAVGDTVADAVTVALRPEGKWPLAGN